MARPVQKIAFISQSVPQSWISCQTIYRNLVQSYQAAYAGSEVRYFQLSPGYSHYEAYRLSQEIYQNNIERIIFVDYAPHPGKLIQFLGEFEAAARPELVFHIYGDFVLQADAWLKIEAELKLFKVQFVCASHKQAGMLESFLIQAQVEVIPFAVDEDQFYFSEELRKGTRQKWNIQDDEIICFYSGRLSLQKNILPLIRAFGFFQKHIWAESRLIFAGPIDDLGVPYLAKQSPPGIMAFDIQTAIRHSMDANEGQKIQYLGNLNAQELNATGNAADLFLSLSGHNDEDFGMSPAEALMTGCYSVLTDWGGYSSFKRYVPDNVSLVPIQIGASIAPSQNDILKKMASAPLKISSQHRAQQAMNAASHLSIRSVEEKLNIFVQKESQMFFGFSDLFRRVHLSLTLNPEAPFRSAGTYSQLYKEVYRVYANS